MSKTKDFAIDQINQMSDSDFQYEQFMKEQAVIEAMREELEYEYREELAKIDKNI